MTKKISIALAQMDFVVGDISGNTELIIEASKKAKKKYNADCLLYTSPSPRDRQKSRMPSSA